MSLSMWLRNNYNNYYQNYENCFENNNEVSSIVPYEILNSTGVSSILWPSHGGIYVFVATVIGKDYT